ncbi:MAG: transaldolase, partial [Thermomicrobiales bacterium]
MTKNAIRALLEHGQSVWQDDISRDMLSSGFLQRQVDEVGIRGVTSNPTIFEKAISGGDAYDDQIVGFLGNGKTADEIFEAIAVADVRDACDVLRPVFDDSNGADGFVSIEVSPDAARNPTETRGQVRRLWDSVNRPNLMVKIPGTVEAELVIEEMLREGKNINITLLFSIHHYEKVALAYVSALENRLAAGEPVDNMASVASFFVSRVDTLVDKKLQAIIDETNDPAQHARISELLGKVAIANAKLAYARFLDIFGGARFAPLRAAGAKVQRPLWASTGTKNPAYSDVLYVESLVGPDTVNTMPRATIKAFLDHGTVRSTLEEEVDVARQIMKDLATAGIDIDQITGQLEDEGIASFVKSFEELLNGVEAK